MGSVWGRKASNYKNLQGILLKIETLQTLELLILFFFGLRTCTNEIGWACGKCYKFGYQQKIYGW